MAGRIRRNRTKNEFYALLMHTLTTGGNLQCGTDGGLRNNTGTFGLVIAIEDKIVWEGGGPVDGNPDTASSKRSELFGYAGLLEFLLMIDCLLLKADDVFPRTQVYTYIDNSSVVRQLKSFLLGYRPKRTYIHDADIVSHIRWLWTQLPRFDCHVTWVKAHQDEKTSFNLLDLPAQLNVCADSMATEYCKHATHPSELPRSQPAFFPSAHVCLVINTQRITSQYTESIRFHIHGTKHRAHLQKTRPTWKSDIVWNNIDMKGLGISFKSLDTPSRHFISKMLHGWLNTGHQRRKITKDPLSSLCPCCHAPDETYEHILRCSAASVVLARDKFLAKMKKLDVRGTTTWKVFHQAVQNWLLDGDAMKHPCLDNYILMPGHRVLLTTALKNQDKIGWNYALRGYLSTSWVEAEYHINRAAHDDIRKKWLRKIIKVLWSFNKTMWTHRNSVLHSTTVPLRELKESAVNTKIRTLFEQQPDFAVLDQVLFDTPLEVMLSRPLQAKKHWIRLVQRYHPSTYSRKTGKQHRITAFFPRQMKVTSSGKPSTRPNTCRGKHDL
jgi:hypothetical protein